MPLARGRVVELDTQPMRRREFLWVSGAMASSLFLTYCGASDDGVAPLPSGSPLPNGLRFTPLLQAGDSLPGGGQVGSFNGYAMIVGTRVYFGAHDALGIPGVYAGDVTSGADAPVLANVVKVVRVGDVLGDGKTVTKFSHGEVAEDGSFAAILTDEYGLPAVYRANPGLGLTRIVGAGDILGSEPQVRLGAQSLCLALDGPDLLLVTTYGIGSQRPQQGLFHFPSSVNDGQSRRIVATGQMSPGATTLITKIGLVDFANGRFVLESGIAGTTTGAPELMEGTPASAPRIDADGRLGQVLLGESSQHAMMLGGVMVATSGDPSPSGESVHEHFFPPILAPNGLAYCLTRCQHMTTGVKRWEFMVTNGTSRGHLLTFGDSVGGMTIDQVTGGAFSSQASATGRLIMTGSVNGKATLLTAAPV